MSKEKFNPEETNKEAEEIINSLGLEDTEAGKHMKDEPTPAEEELKEKGAEALPAQKESIEKFLKKVEEYTAEGRESGNTRTAGDLELPDGRIVNIWRKTETDNLPHYQASAALLVRELNEGGGWAQTSYLLYSDGRMEKKISITTPQDLNATFSSSRLAKSAEEVRERAREGLNKIREMINAEEEERQAGLRGATESDMREAEKIFELLKKGRKY